MIGKSVAFDIAKKDTCGQLQMNRTKNKMMAGSDQSFKTSVSKIEAFIDWVFFLLLYYDSTAVNAYQDSLML